MPTLLLSLVIQIIGALVLWLFYLPIAGQVHAAAPITPSGLNTQVSGPIVTGSGPTQTTQYDITGGTRPGGGTNLFHSFGDFNIPNHNIANFLNDSGLATSNILGRVTGGNPSTIFGIIQTTDFGNANLFLMNPTGFLFGPNATVNVGGMVAFTTADYLRLSNLDGSNAGIFHADTAQASALTSAPVAAFGFLGSNPAAIAVQGSTLTVAPSQSISLVGGDRGFEYTDPDTGHAASTSVPGGVTITGGKLLALGGQINLASVASPGEILFAGLQSAPNINGQSFSNMGAITLSQGTTLDVSADVAGTVRIRGGQFVMDQATISADTVNANGAPVAIDINVTGDISVSTVDVPALTARTTGAGNAGDIRISSGSMDVTATAVNSFYSVIDTHTSGPGNAGSVNIETGDLAVLGGSVNFIDSGTSGVNPGRGGNVTITAHNIQTQDTTITTGNFTAFLFDEGGAGTAGNVTITADSLQMTSSQIVTDSADFVSPVGTAGNITINARNINLEGTSFSGAGQEHGGAITITADQLFANSTIIATQTINAAGGSITVTGRSIELTNGSSFVSTTDGDGHAGSISIVATDHLSLLPGTSFGRPSGIFSSSFGGVGTAGNAGDIFITTPRLEMTGGARIDTSTATSGRGGNVTIHTADSLSISGETDGQPIEPLFSLGSLQPSGIFTRTVSGNCSGLCGNAGNISITTGSLTMGSGAQINSGTSGSGQGGTIAINAGSTISISGTLSTGQPGGIQSRTIGAEPDAGAGGNIALTTGQSVTISDGASVSASSTGPGNTGNIQINAGNQFAMTNSTVTTEANAASGGIIEITTDPNGMVQLTNSTISASVLDGTGGGGSVNIDPQFVILQNSQILARAVQGPGGNISITTNLLLPDANSVISASSQFGVNGTVTIQSPNAPGAGEIVPLSQEPLPVTSLLNQRCAALAGGEFSSFTVAGRDSLPTEPGSWLASPLHAAGVGGGMQAEGERLEDMTLRASSADETTFLSLRQIAPAGFLTQAFAADWSVGCQS